MSLIFLRSPEFSYLLYYLYLPVQPFTEDFPRADIHELLAPDLLHQVVKGVFKDHLVKWVCQYIISTHGERKGKEILDDIDHRYAKLIN